MTTAIEEAMSCALIIFVLNRILVSNEYLTAVLQKINWRMQTGVRAVLCFPLIVILFFESSETSF